MESQQGKKKLSCKKKQKAEEGEQTATTASEKNGGQANY